MRNRLVGVFKHTPGRCICAAWQEGLIFSYSFPQPVTMLWQSTDALRDFILIHVVVYWACLKVMGCWKERLNVLRIEVS